MDIHQAAKALVKQIDETGELPRLRVGLCLTFAELGVQCAFSDMDELRAPVTVLERRHDGYMQGLGPVNEWMKPA